MDPNTTPRRPGQATGIVTTPRGGLAAFSSPSVQSKRLTDLLYTPPNRTVSVFTLQSPVTVPIDPFEPQDLDNQQTSPLEDCLQVAPSTPQLPSAPSTQASSDEPQTRNVIDPKTGRFKTACNGPLCRTSAKPPVRNASTCTHQYCLKCCVEFQRNGALPCALSTHGIERTDLEDTPSAPDNTPSIPSTPTPKSPANYDSTRPLKLAHYLAKEESMRIATSKTDEIIQMNVALDKLKKSVTLLYWKVCGGFTN